MKEVWIAYKDDGCEGKSEPLAAFATERLANIFLDGAKSNYSTMEVIKLPVIHELPAEESPG